MINRILKKLVKHNTLFIAIFKKGKYLTRDNFTSFSHFVFNKIVFTINKKKFGVTFWIFTQKLRHKLLLSIKQD
jgi:hypothetical protein